MAYVIHGSAGANGVVDVAVNIGTGTSRKAMAFFAHDNGLDELAGTAAYDPAGTNVAMTKPTNGGQAVLNSGDSFYMLDCFYYDIPDGQSGSKTFRFTPASGNIRGAAGVVVYDGMATGAPEALEFTEYTGGATSLSDSITTLSANAVILGGAMLGGVSMAGAQFTPTNGQTERVDIVGDEYVALSIGVIEKATAGAQTFGSSFASRPVGAQILTSFAAAASAVNYSLAADAGVFEFNGTDATLTHDPASTAYSLTADSGTFQFVGSAISFEQLTRADPGVFEFAGTAATLTYTPASEGTIDYTLIAASGAFQFSGTAATLAHGIPPEGTGRSSPSVSIGISL